jgi:hypothetical protein
VEERKTENNSKRERERKGEREKMRGRGKCHLKGCPKAGIPGLGHCQKKMPNQLARCHHVKWTGAPVGVGGILGATL